MTFIEFLKQERYFFLTFFIFIIFFRTFSQLDIYTSSLFFSNGEFYLKHHTLLKIIYDYTEKIALILGIFILGGVIITKYKTCKILGIKHREFYFLTISILIGPVLVVNVLLKGFVGRARPDKIVEFGGVEPFTKAFDLTATYCASNCSFVCGHCSAAFIMIIFAYLYKKNHHLVYKYAFTYGIIASFARIAQGKHFLSDAIFSFFIVYTIIKITYFFIMIPHKKWITTLSNTKIHF